MSIFTGCVYFHDTGYTLVRTNENAQCPSSGGSGARVEFQTSVDRMARCGRDKLENLCQGQFMLMATGLWPHHFQLEQFTTHQSKQKLGGGRCTLLHEGHMLMYHRSSPTHKNGLISNKPG